MNDEKRIVGRGEVIDPNNIKSGSVIPDRSPTSTTEQIEEKRSAGERRELQLG
jgi:hypothetical protein